MKLKSIFAAAVVLVGAFAGSAHASVINTWTVTASGTIASGTDTSGIFGTAGKNLAGLSFTQSITASVDSTLYSSKYTSATSVDMYSYSAGPAFTATVTVDGHTVTYNVASASYEEQIIIDNFSKNKSGNDEIYTSDFGVDTSGKGTISLTQYAYGQLALVPSLDFHQVLSIPAASGVNESLSFAVRGVQNASFSANKFLMTVNAPTSNVPEPTSIALLGLGFASMGLMRRRKAK